jgi:hypothetical protein
MGQAAKGDEFAWLDGADDDIAWLLDEEKAEVEAAAAIAPVAVHSGVLTLEEARRIVAEADEKDRLARVVASTKLDCEKLRGSVMFGTVQGKKRIWACDGEYVFFRRKSCGADAEGRDLQGQLHQAIVRHNRFLANGDYTYVETQDDVEICRVNPQSALYRKGMYLGEMNDAALRRGIALAACKRDWALYVDMLTEVSGRIKAKVPDKIAGLVYNEMLEYITILIAQRGGPSPMECAAGLQSVRQRRGEGSGQMILLPHGRA